jgi:hypothetical protein
MLLAAEAAIGVDGPVRCAPDNAFDYTDPGRHVELGFLGVAVFLPTTDPIAVADSEALMLVRFSNFPECKLLC